MLHVARNKDIPRLIPKLQLALDPASYTYLLTAENAHG